MRKSCQIACLSLTKLDDKSNVQRVQDMIQSQETVQEILLFVSRYEHSSSRLHRTSRNEVMHG